MEQKTRPTKPPAKRKRVQSKSSKGALDSSAILSMSQTTSSSSESCNFSATLPSQIPNPFSVVSQQPHHYQFQQSTSPGINMFPRRHIHIQARHRGWPTL